jgi:DNA-binding GntR family transcriptional regulator
MAQQNADYVEPIHKRTLHDEVLPRVRDMIIEGVLDAGTRINETELGLRLGVSRTPLREAIKTLAGEGLIELVTSKGAVVRRFTRNDVAHMLESLKLFEMFAAKQACLHATDAEIRAVVKLHKSMVQEYKKRNRLSYYKLNQEIHTVLVRLGGNPVIADLHGMMQSRLKRIRYLGNHETSKWASAMAEHEEMMKALAARDGEALAEVMGRHMDQTLLRVSDII